MKEKIVISLGGSLLFPDNDLDVDFIRSFKTLIEEQIKHNKQFFLITGGGKICRKYQNALLNLSDLSRDDLDWMGIYTTHVNAQFMRFVFGDIASPNVITKESEIEETDAPVVLGGGWEPGCSTDYDVVELAHIVDAKRIINLSNIDYAYDSDPKVNPQAKKIESITWSEYRSLIPEEWDPGLNTPFDPIAAKKAEELEMDVVIMNGKNIPNIRKYLENDPFIGTHIHI